MGNIKSSTNFSKYYISGKRIGSGTFATVKRCVRKSDNKEFAVKIVKKSQLTRDEELLLCSEIEILSFINYPNIISIQEAFESDKKVKIVLELCDDKNLMDKINESPNRRLKEFECAQITYCIAKTLHYLHCNFIVHRDLKPENILFDKNGILKLTDFGCAFAAYKNREKYGNDMKNIKISKQIGTPYYVAPEVIVNKYYNHQVDLWSLGVILYQMLCGYHPFNTRKSIHHLYKQIINGQYKFNKKTLWQNISDDAIDLIKKLMNIDPNQRITTDQLFQHPWIVKYVHNNNVINDFVADNVELIQLSATRLV